MKHKFSLIWRVAVALVLVLSFSLVAAVPVAAEPDVSDVRVELSNYADAGTGVTYYVYFTSGVDLTKNVDTITVRFPTGTTGIASSNAAQVDPDADAVLYGNTTVAIKSATAQRFIMTTPVNITAGTEVRVEIASITNPDITDGTTKAYTLKVSTSQETTEVESSPYTIGLSEVASATFTPTTSVVAGANTDYTIEFNASSSGALTADLDSVTVIFPPGTTVTTPIAATSIEVKEDDTDTYVDLEVAPIVSGRTVTLTVPTPSSSAYEDSDTITVHFKAAAKIYNATLATHTDPPNHLVHKGSYIGKVYTSQDLGIERASAYTIAPHVPAALKFYSGSPSSVAVGTASATITVRSNDQYGNMADGSGSVDVKINLSSNSTTGLFRGDNEDDADGDGDIDSSDADWTSTNPCTYIDTGAYIALLMYKDTTVGTATITASSPYGWTSDTWDIDVVEKAVALWDGTTLVGTYGTIAAAEADALPFNTIKVGPGTYQFSSTLTIDVAYLTLESTDGAASTIIDALALTSGGFDGAGILIDDVAGVTVDGFTVNKVTGAAAIYCRSDYAIIQNNVVNFLAEGTGIDVGYMATGVTVSGNELNEYSNMIVHGSDCTVSGNTLNRVLNVWPEVGATITGVTIRDNIFPTNPDCTSINLMSHDTNSIISNSSIKGNTISNREYGIWVGAYNPSNLTVTNLIITGNTITGSTKDGIKIETWPSSSAGRIMFNNISGNAYYGIENTDADAVAADHNWWGDASGPTVATNPGGTGDKITSGVTYAYWLGASVSAAAYAASAASLNAQSTVGVRVSSSDPETDIGVARYTSNPKGTPEFTVAEDGFFDVYALAGNWSDDLVNIKLYSDGVTSSSKAYFWDAVQGEWIECYEQDAASGYVWVNVRPYSATYPGRVPVLTDLLGLPFTISVEAAVDILAYYRAYSGDPLVVETTDLLKAANDWANAVVPPGFTEPISTTQLLTLANEWAATE